MDGIHRLARPEPQLQPVRAAADFRDHDLRPGDEDPRITEAAEFDEYQERYATEEAAQAGHDRALSFMRGRLGADALADIVGPLVPGSSDEDWDGSIEGER